MLSLNLICCQDYDCSNEKTEDPRASFSRSSALASLGPNGETREPARGRRRKRGCELSGPPIRPLSRLDKA